MRKGTSAMSLSRRAAAQRAVARPATRADGPLRHRVVSREVLDGLVGSDVDEEGVDLDEFARPDRLHALGQALGVALAHDAQAAWTGLRRSTGTGVTTPLAMSFVRMRPTIETETSIPSRRKRTASLRLPHIG